MFLQNTILGADTILNLFHCENEGVTPSASSVKLLRQIATSPFWAVVATYDVLAVGGVVDATTGLYGLKLSTASESAGTMSINWTWTSSVTGLTYTETAQFDIVADNNALLSRIGTISSELVKRPFPDNVSIRKICDALGIDDPSNPLNLDYFVRNAKKTDDIYNMVDSIRKTSKQTKQRVDKTKDIVRDSLVEYDAAKMQNYMNNLAQQFMSMVESLKAALTNEVELNNQDGKLNTIRALDIWSRQVASMFTKVDYAISELQEIKNNQVDFAQALPQMVVQEQGQMMDMALQGMIAQMAQGQPQQPMT